MKTVEKIANRSGKNRDLTGFPSAYRNYSDIYHKFSLAEDRKGLILKEIKRLCSSQKTVLLDIGCGTGRYIVSLASSCKKVIGIDPIESQLEYALNQTSNLRNVVCILGDGENIPLSNESINVVIITWVTFRNPSKALKEILRVTNKNGVIIRVSPYKIDDLTSLFPSLNLATIKRNNDLFESFGFKCRYRKISIDFRSTADAKRVVSTVIGCDENRVKKNLLYHNVVIQKYKKTKFQ